jgi:hypothetical protein
MKVSATLDYVIAASGGELQQAQLGRILRGAAFFEKFTVARTSKFLAWIRKT